MLWFVAVAFWSKEEVSSRRGPQLPIFAPPLIRPLADLAEKQQNLWGTMMSTSSLPSFIKNPSSSSGEEIKNVKSWGQIITSDAGWTTRYDNSSLEPSAPVS